MHPHDRKMEANGNYDFTRAPTSARGIKSPCCDDVAQGFATALHILGRQHSDFRPFQRKGNNGERDLAMSMSHRETGSRMTVVTVSWPKIARDEILTASGIWDEHLTHCDTVL